MAFALPVISVSAQSGSTEIKLNQIQVIGTHNSYHVGIAPGEVTLWQAKYAESYKSLDYRHQSLDEQFNSGIRQIELDIFADTQGGRYAHPSGPAMVEAAHLPADLPFDPGGVMLKPGFKVMHTQDIDYRSNCQPFVACLQQVRNWSQKHPKHVPVFIIVETKQGSPTNLKLTDTEPFTSAVFDALDAEIRSVFPAEELLTPDDVRGGYSTLNQAVLAGAMPNLESARGKVIFLMDQHDVGPVYLSGHPSLRGRVLFTNADPGQPDALFIERNAGPAAEIRALVGKGYLVRTRTDADTKQARTNDTTTRDAMMDSGAQMLSTDYPVHEPARWPGNYVVAFPDHSPARCNPVNAPVGCSSALATETEN